MTSDNQLLRIKEILESHRGKENQISSGKIGPQIGIYEDATHVQVRSLIRNAIEKLKLPVGGGSRGYYLIKDDNELEEYYIRNIDNRINKMQKRKDLVESASMFWRYTIYNRGSIGQCSKSDLKGKIWIGSKGHQFSAILVV